MAGVSPQESASVITTLVGAVLCRRFKLVRLIGEGAMGAVFEAHRIELQASSAAQFASEAGVAIKMLHAEYLSNLGVVERFEEEGRLCKELIHPNVVRVEAVLHAENGVPFLVMELLRGFTLSAYAGRKIPALQAVAILQGILAGLAAAHAAGIVHRDLKPENVYITHSSEGAYAVKVLDFGVAKVIEAAGGMGGRTRTGVLLGTPAYMSPEQVASAKDVDARSDLFAAGALFYEMLTGKKAFDGDTEFAQLSAVMAHNPAPIESVDPQLAPFASFVTRALSKAPSARFGDAGEMGRALGAAAMACAPPGFRAHAVELLPAPVRSGGTLASGTHQSGRPPSAIPRVEIVSSPCAEPPPLRAGVVPIAASIAVLLAFLAGFGAGFVVGRL